MQSQKSKTSNKPRLPHGWGSATRKGRVFWLTYRDAAGGLHYENSGTEDAGEAHRLMAERALPRARAIVADLERIANGQKQTNPGKGSSGSGAKPRAAGRGRGKAVSNSGRGTRAKKGGRK